jgi:glucosamine-phosphate N-acetyltransferase
MDLTTREATDLTICELTSADLGPRFLETLAALGEVGLSVREAEEVYRQRRGQGVRTYVALWRGQVVGTASLLLERKFLHKGGLVGHIEDVAVHRDFRLRGTGTAVVGHATEEARKLGCYKVVLDCFEDLVPFYGRLGYRPHNVGLRVDF